MHSIAVIDAIEISAGHVSTAVGCVGRVSRHHSKRKGKERRVYGELCFIFTLGDEFLCYSCGYRFTTNTGQLVYIDF
jgi:hypothetical protein